MHTCLPVRIFVPMYALISAYMSLSREYNDGEK